MHAKAEILGKIFTAMYYEETSGNSWGILWKGSCVNRSQYESQWESVQHVNFNLCNDVITVGTGIVSELK